MNHSDAVPESITTTMVYMVDDKTRGHFFFTEKPRSFFEKFTDWASGYMPWKDHSGSYTDVKVQVQNGRNKQFDFDTHSFSFAKWKTELSYSDFCEMDKNEEIKSKYYKEMKKYATEVLGADYADVLHHQLRNSKIAEESNKNPAHGKFANYATAGIHTDASPSSADDLYYYMYKDKPEIASDDSNKRYLYFNIWRSIDSENPIKNHHLAVCDQTSVVSPEDFMFRDLWMRGPEGGPIPWYKVPQYTLNVRHFENHKWYYFPDMVKDEIICFKQADSDYRNKGRMTFHCAVEDPNASVNDPPRQSIEARLFCVFKNQDINTVPEKSVYGGYEKSKFYEEAAKSKNV